MVRKILKELRLAVFFDIYRCCTEKAEDTSDALRNERSVVHSRRRNDRYVEAFIDDIRNIRPRCQINPNIGKYVMILADKGDDIVLAEI